MPMLMKFRLKLVPSALLVGVLTGCGSTHNPPPPQKADYHAHTVKYSGETLGLISLWYTKRTDNWKQIQQANPKLDINRMSLGEQVLIPMELVKRIDPFAKSMIESTPARQVAAPLEENPKSTASTSHISEIQLVKPQEGVTTISASEESTEQDNIATTGSESSQQVISTIPTEVSAERQALLDELLAE